MRPSVPAFRDEMEKISVNVLRLAETAAEHGIDVTRGNWRQFAKAILKGRDPRLMRPTERMQALALERSAAGMEVGEVQRAAGGAPHLLDQASRSTLGRTATGVTEFAPFTGRTQMAHSHPSTGVIYGAPKVDYANFTLRGPASRSAQLSRFANAEFVTPGGMPAASATPALPGGIPNSWVGRPSSEAVKGFEKNYISSEIARAQEKTRVRSEILAAMQKDVPRQLQPSGVDVANMGSKQQRGLWHSILAPETGELAHYRVTVPIQEAPPLERVALGGIGRRGGDPVEGVMQFLMDRKATGPLRRAPQLEKVSASRIAQFIREAPVEQLGKHFDDLWRSTGGRPPVGFGAAEERLARDPVIRERLVGAMRRAASGTMSKRQAREAARRQAKGLPSGLESTQRMTPEWKQALREASKGEMVTLETGVSSRQVPSIVQFGPSSTGQRGAALWLSPLGTPRTADYARRATQSMGTGGEPHRMLVDLPRSVAQAAGRGAANPGEYSLRRDVFKRWAKNVRSEPVW